MSDRIEGKVAVVTGGANGIGRGIVDRFHEEGASIVVADLAVAEGEELVARLGDRVHFQRTDVTVEDDVAAAVDAAVERFGGLDIMVTNAGRFGPNAPLAQLRLDKWNETVANLLGGVFLGMKHARRAMRPHAGASIIAIGSTAGTMGGFGTHCYTACKHAVIGLVKSAAGEFSADGIRVNAVSPGKIVTRMAALGLVGDADDFAGAEALIAKNSPLGVAGFPVDIANAVLYLASDESRYVTGHNLRVDAGTSVLGPNAQIYRMNT